MNPDTDARHESGTNVGIRLRTDRFELATRVLGCESDADRARLLDVDPKTIYRARRGAVGEEFIAKTLVALTARNSELWYDNQWNNVTFEEFFEIVVLAPEVVAA